jgi:hypothetical protein
MPTHDAQATEQDLNASTDRDRESISIDGSTFVPPELHTRSKGPGDKEILSQTLYESGDVSIMRESVTVTKHPFFDNDYSSDRVLLRVPQQMTLKIAAIPRQLGVVRYETINRQRESI